MIFDMVKKIFVFLAICFFSSNVFAFTISCERTKASTVGFADFSAMESWYPPNIQFDANDFEEKPNSKVLIITKRAMQDIVGQNHVMMINLLTSGKMVMQLKGRSGVKDAGVARYECSHNANEVRDFINNPPSSDSTNSNSNSSSTQSESTSIKDKSDRFICIKATTGGSEKRWESESGVYSEYVAEAKRRNLTCDVSSASSDDNSKNDICSKLRQKASEHIDKEEYDDAERVSELLEKFNCS